MARDVRARAREDNQTAWVATTESEITYERSGMQVLYYYYCRDGGTQTTIRATSVLQYNNT
jgi:hypothetical protein